MSDELTTAYLLGIEDMRSKLHKQADEIERLRAENKQFHKQAEMNARLLTENADLRQIIERLREALEEMREACQANYMLGIERGKEDARQLRAARKALGDTDG